MTDNTLPFDWTQPLTEDELVPRILRTNGDMICPYCGKPYYKHPYEQRLLAFDDYPFLHQLCNGWLAKL